MEKLFNRKRRPWLAALVSLFFYGLGHVYVGEVRRWLIVALPIFSSMFILAWAGALSSICGYALFALLLIGLSAFSVIDAFLLARLRSDYCLKRYNRWYGYVMYAAVLTLLSNLFFISRGTTLGYETYHIPSGAMVPTLMVGDYILVDTRAYKNHPPKFGDVVVFPYPVDPSLSYVKRVIATEGQKVAISKGVTYINGSPVSEPYIVLSAQPRASDFPEAIVPEGQLFVLGDNRDASSDSRIWGTVPAHTVIGKVTDIWWSRDTSRIGTTVF